MLDPLKVSSYDYTLPQNLIAFHPKNNKNNARVLVYIRSLNKIIHTTFKDIFYYIPANTSVIINDTKVVKARIFGKKDSGGKVELLLNSPLQDNLYAVYIKGRVAKDTKLFFDNNLQAFIKEIKDDGIRIVAFYANGIKINTDELFDILEVIGHVPLPPYIKREDTDADVGNYQSIFAKNRGAVAAPTASLHFSKEKFDELQKRYKTKKITLHVGAGTFKPVTCENIKNHVMHSEFFNIDIQTQELLDSKERILAIGTTVTRTIEYYIREKKASGYCNLFLHPRNKPKRVNHLLTNFHLPKSTLIMLVASFIGIEKTLKLYEVAVREKYRFFSYGDAMLII